MFLSYSNEAAGRVSRISSFRTLDNGATLDPGTERILLTVDQPARKAITRAATSRSARTDCCTSDSATAAAAATTMAPSAMDSGSRRCSARCCASTSAQIPTGPRIRSPLTIRSSTATDHCPAAGRAERQLSGDLRVGLPQSLALELRSRSNGELWVADVGQGTWEEVDQVTIGSNYGWRCREGAHDFNTVRLQRRRTDRSGRRVRSFAGCLDHRRLRVSRHAEHEPGRPLRVRRFRLGPHLGVDRRERAVAARADAAAGHELRASLRSARRTTASCTSCNYGGTLHHIDFTTGPVNDPAPRNLSQTGCVVASNPQQPATGLIPYAINAPFWSDGANKERWLALPDGQVGHSAHRRRLGLPESHGADEELPRRHAADRDAPADAPPGRHLGRLHVRVERAADATQRWSRAARCATSATARTGSSRARRNAWSATPTPRAARSGWKPRSSIAPSLTRRPGAPRTSSRR